MDAKTIRDQAHIKDVVDQLGMDVHHAGDSYFVKCPCHEDTHPSAFFKEHDNYIYCTVCQKNINAIDLIMYVRQVPFKDALNELASIEGIQISGKPQKFTKNEIKPSEASFIGVNPEYKAFMSKQEFQALMQMHMIHSKKRLKDIEEFLDCKLQTEAKELEQIGRKLKIEKHR